METKSGIEYIIRKVSVDDAKGMLDYLDQVARDSDNLTFGPGEMTVTLDSEIAFLEKLQTADNEVMFIAVHNNRIISCLSYAGGHRARTRHVGEFGVSVIKEYWHQGIGKAMMLQLLKWAEDSKYCEKINLKVREDNTHAITLYEKLGFIKEGLILKDMKIKGEYINCIFMGREIKRSSS